MDNRAPLLLALIAIIVIAVVFVNLDLVSSGFQHPASLTRLLTWQGESASQRSLRLREGLDLQGGLQVLLQGSMVGTEPGDLERAAGIIQSRIDSLGVTEPLVQTQGDDKIVVELPGVRDPDLAVRTIGETALLEFVYSGAQRLEPDTEIVSSWRLSQTLLSDLPEDRQQPFLEEVPVPSEAGSVVGGSEVVTPTAAVAPTAVVTATAGVTTTAGLTTTEAVTTTAAVTTTDAAAAAAGDDTDTAAVATETKTVYPTVLTGEYLQTATQGFDPVTNEIIVNFQLTSQGGRLMQAFTRDHVSDATREEIMPIVLDGKVISAPAIRDQIAGSGQISGRFTGDEAQALVAQLNSGSLPVELTVVGQTGIGPTLGREALEAAVKGGIVGLLVVMLYMLLYYRMPGLIASAALVIYALILLTLFRIIPVTLTLAGIAGFILSLGMAVDANILIFERMKEELRAGRRLSAAMDIGFQRAWPSIRDSNVATLITCVILFWFGSQFGASIVKGFAVTLFLGVIVSLFTAIVVTRNFLWLTNRVIVGTAQETGPVLENRRLRFLFGF